MDDLSILLSLQQVLAKVGDSHTNIDFWARVDHSKVLPLKSYWFDDGIYVLETAARYENLLGSRLVAINEHPVEEVIDSLETFIVRDNDSWIKNKIPHFLRFPQLLLFFGFVPAGADSVSMTFINKDGGTVRQQITSEPIGGNFVAVKTKGVPLFQQNRTARFWERYLEDGTYYVQYNSCTGGEVFDKFSKRIFAVLSEKPVKRFVFDMRFNGGGNSAPGTALVRELSKNPEINKKRVLYVIVGRGTFSSAVINTINFMQETEAIIVGENTAGKPNCYGELGSFVLPDSEVKVYYSTKYFRFMPEDLPTISPEIKAVYTFNDYLNGVDTSMEAVVKRSESF